MARTTKAKQMSSLLSQNPLPLEDFIKIYKGIHSNPELGENERETAALVVSHLKSLDFEVKSNIGGHGLVGILRNGEGPTILLRADMDALPIREDTGLPYASQKTVTDNEGNKHPVMHACGHDMHVTSLLGAANVLKSTSSHWSGTLICLFQPNEENGKGAQAMVDDGLYDQIPTPDFCLAQHCYPLRTGKVAIRPGPTMSAADSFNVTIYGHGGHGSRPESCIDPIVIASYIIVRLQSVVSRVVSPQDAAVVTCGSIHGGSAHNIIPNKVDFKLNVRTYSESVRKKVLNSIHKIIESECEAAGSPKKPDIIRTHDYPLTSNNPKVADTVQHAFEEYFGNDRVETMEPCAASEDFSNIALPHKVPYAFWFVGATDAEQYDEAVKNDRTSQLPGLHTEKFAPAVDPTLETGIRALSVAALTYLIK